MKLKRTVKELDEGQSRKKGQWYVDDDGQIWCSECRGTTVREDTSVFPPFCQWCGAKMDGGEEDE